jgi:hypothetical protein
LSVGTRVKLIERVSLFDIAEHCDVVNRPC